jgi:hypothetical protein
MRMQCTCPDLDAELFFDVDEVRRAYLLTEVKQPAKPEFNALLRLSTQVRDFLGRKGDGEPGAKAIWYDRTEVHVAAKTLQGSRSGGGAAYCV